MPVAGTPEPPHKRTRDKLGDMLRQQEQGSRFARFPARLPRNPDTGPPQQQAQFLDMLGALNTRIGDLGTLLDEMAPRVISTETVVLDANGTATRQYRVPYRSLGVDYFGAATLTVAAAPLAQFAPGPGPGVGKVGPGGFAVLNFRAYEWTLYGNPGDLITVTAYARPQPANGVVNGTGGVMVTPASDYPLNAIPVSASSGNQANANAVATLPGVAGKTTWITGFEMTSAGATGAGVLNPTVAGVLGGTLTYTYACIAGATLANAPLIVEFPKPVPASAANTAIVVTLPALGAGNANATCVAHGYQL
jgi:hypothetical protein